MRKYMENIIHGLIHGHNAHGNPVTVNGKATFNARVHCGIVYSYDTPIARREGNRIYVDMDYYSPTTTRQRNEIIHACKSNGLHVIELVGTKIVP